MSKRALIIIDIQNDYFPGGKWTLDGAEAAADNAARLLAAARERGDLVVHVRHEFESADAPFFVPGSAGAQFHPKVAPAAGEAVVLKHKVNSFRDTQLKALLDQHDIKALTIAGSMSHMCIDARPAPPPTSAMKSAWPTMPARRWRWSSTARRLRRPMCTPRQWPRWHSPTPG